MVAALFSTLAGVALLSAQSASAVTPPQTSAGTDFWLAFEGNYDDQSDLFLFISGSTATTGTVTDPGISFSQSFTVTPGTVTQVAVPTNAQDANSDSVDPDGIHVTAGSPVSVYGLNTEEYTTDGYLGLPTNILGTSYLVEGYTGGFGLGSDFAVVGTQDNTTVTIDPVETVGTHTAGTPYTVDLSQGQVYQLGDSGTGDLSGTSISSTNPVAVFAGNGCADVPPQDVACNTLTEEMTPTVTWGTDFLTEPLATRSGDTFRFMASENGTTVNVNGSPVATLNAGQFYETILSSTSEITSNNPIQVMQYSNGSSYDGANADPFDITIPPYEQFLNSYTVTTEPNGADPAITNNYINVVAPTSEVGSVTLDGTPIPASDFAPIGSSTFSGAQLSVAFGDHNLAGPLPFGVTVYGYGGYDGYGYPGGFTLSPIATVSQVSLTTTGGSGVVGTQACSTATATDQNGNPVSGVRVDFTVTGVNPNAGFAYTGSNGQAQYCYTGQNAGQDSIVAVVGSVHSTAATWTWTLAPTTVATSLSGGGQSGTSISVPPGTGVTDQATLSGANAATATGTVTYDVYSNAGCTDLVNSGMAQTISTPGTLPASAAVSLSTPGTYYWEATYSGDTANAGSPSTCGATGEVETVSSVAQATSLATSLAGGGQTGTSITVPSGTPVTDAATLSGTNAASATGTVTYNVYSDAGCTMLASPGTAESITKPGSLPPSAPVTLSGSGPYYWQASYSGDANNKGSTSTCGSAGEVETVTAATTAPGLDGPLVHAFNGNGKVTATISPSANDLLVAFVAGCGPSSTPQTAQVTGGGLTWTFLGRTNGEHGTTEVWSARASGTAKVPVKAALSSTGYPVYLTVAAFSNATGTGKVTGTSGATGAPTWALTTSSSPSWVWGVGNDPQAATGRKVPAGQTLESQKLDASTQDTFWVQSLNAEKAPAGSSATISDKAPTSDPWNLTLVEIL